MAFLMESCEEMTVSVNSHKPAPAPFLTKTYQLVDDPSTDHVVSWGEDNTTFVVWRPPEFSRDLLPKYFKHSNFSSFVRQLNTYGFRKMVADRWEFANEFFKRGEKQLLSEIHRRKSFHHHHHNQQQQQQYALCNTEDISGWVQTPPPCYGGEDDRLLSALSEDNRQLRRRNSLLLSELIHMQKLYNDIIYFIQNHVSCVPPHRGGGRLIEMAISGQPQLPSGARCSLTIEEEEANCSIKLFGVPIPAKFKEEKPN
ncbi:hypothetical protein HPP92_014842 [Vanilla planifolia]|uniref:HSF-type DNA-binding domain-containing protein n=1 Tax=Vanilla planifolia TaxID=51239 RepID=A0A835QQC6_VANPL|nr:hypothetical protein HPP92_014842 [Vanilla planifolia]